MPLIEKDILSLCIECECECEHKNDNESECEYKFKWKVELNWIERTPIGICQK